MKYFNASGFGSSETFDCGCICKFVDVGEHPPRKSKKKKILDQSRNLRTENKITGISGSDSRGGVINCYQITSLLFRVVHCFI